LSQLQFDPFGQRTSTIGTATSHGGCYLQFLPAY